MSLDKTREKASKLQNPPTPSPDGPLVIRDAATLHAWQARFGSTLVRVLSDDPPQPKEHPDNGAKLRKE